MPGQVFNRIFVVVFEGHSEVVFVFVNSFLNFKIQYSVNERA